MKLDLVRFFQACNPSKTLVLSKPEDRQYYIDFSKVRGAKIIEELGRTINYTIGDRFCLNLAKKTNSSTPKA